MPNKPLSGISASAGTSSAWASDCGVHIQREPLEHQLLRDTLLFFRPGHGRQIVKMSESLTSKVTSLKVSLCLLESKSVRVILDHGNDDGLQSPSW